MDISVSVFGVSIERSSCVMRARAWPQAFTPCGAGSKGGATTPAGSGAAKFRSVCPAFTRCIPQMTVSTPSAWISSSRACSASIRAAASAGFMSEGIGPGLAPC